MHFLLGDENFIKRKTFYFAKILYSYIFQFWSYTVYFSFFRIYEMIIKTYWDVIYLSIQILGLLQFQVISEEDVSNIHQYTAPGQFLFFCV